MDRQQFVARRERMRPLLRQAGLAAMLVTLDANRYYLSGFCLQDPQINESAGCLIIGANGEDWLCTDSRYTGAALRLWDEDHVFIYRGKAMQRVNTLLKDQVRGCIGFEAACLTVAAHEQLAPGLSLQAADGLVESLRVIKEPEEIERIEKACVLNHKLMEWVPGILRPGRTEAQAAWDIEQFFRNHGAEGLSFSSIVAVGSNAALPHAEPGGDLITEDCAVLVDVGCRLNDYCSDQTRSFWVGSHPHPHFTANLKLVKEAQSRAIKAVGPGVPVADVYAVARKYLDDKGVGEYFTHGLGHGIGLQTHESPSLNALSSAVLQPGMVVTVEPGVYHLDCGGIRWEYMVLVTEDGSRIL